MSYIGLTHAIDFTALNYQLAIVLPLTGAYELLTFAFESSEAFGDFIIAIEILLPIAAYFFIVTLKILHNWNFSAEFATTRGRFEFAPGMSSTNAVVLVAKDCFEPLHCFLQIHANPKTKATTKTSSAETVSY